MKPKNNVNQLHPEVDMKNTIRLKTEQIGTNKIEVYAEKSNILQSQANTIEYDFGFLINGEYYRGNENFTISDLYKVYNTVYGSFIEFIENTVLTSDLDVNIIIEACAADEEEGTSKNILYKRIIKKMTKKYGCVYTKHQHRMYVLSFTK